MVSVMSTINTQSSISALSASKCLQQDTVRPTVSVPETFSSMVPSVDTRLANAQKGDVSPFSTPRSTDAGSCSTPSCRSGSFQGCGSSDTVESCGSDSESRSCSSRSSRSSSNFFGAVVTVCSAVLPYSDARPAAAVTPAKAWRAGKASKLPASPTSWAAQHRLRREQEENGEAHVLRSVRSLLNKLTPERFSSIYEQLVAAVQTPSAVAVLVREVFEKATTQHNFIAVYVDLCVRLEDDARLHPASGKAAETFRRILLGQCQSSFEDMLEAGYSGAHSAAHLDDEAVREEERLKRKQRALGNMKLIGQLLNRGMLSSKLLVTCCQELLSEQDSVPDALECLAALLTEAGPTFDKMTGWSLKPLLDAVFVEVRELMQSSAVSARTRFLLRDLLDLRAGDWKDTKRATTGKDSPKRLDEVRLEAAKSAPAQQKPQFFNKAPWQQDWQQNGQKNKPIRRGGKSSRTDCDSASSGSRSPAESDKKRQATASEMLPWAPAAQSPTAAAAAAAAAAVLPPAAAAPQPSVATTVTVRTGPFDKIAFSREVHMTMKELATSHNVPAAVRRIRQQDVPVDKQAAEFADMLARASEESRGPVRRYIFAFITGLANGEQSAFDKEACLEGIKSFFVEDYESLCEEVPKLPAIVTQELVPTLKAVYTATQLEEAAVPRCCQR
eukprot:TRINITY_DN2259_c1_g1_i1.p1 TRINITY_DN2259_c1_g1~~TRINITY_DN2259_c1_g1_i1.p1  ORF type:complete len:671 (-),score=209.15 TRINITY_DN2259_c1_g1_i1:122-2134(-)